MLRSAFAASQRFCTIVFSFSFVFMYFLKIYSLMSWLTHSFFSRMLFNLHVFEDFPNFFLWLTSSFIALWSGNILGMISIFCTCWGLICDPIRDLLWRMFRAHTIRICILLLQEEMSWICLKFTWSSVSFKVIVSLLIFCLDDLSIALSGVLKSPTIMVLLSMSVFMFVINRLIYLDVYMLGA